MHGTFTTGTEVGENSITIPYTGEGYPIFALVMAEPGVPDYETEYYEIGAVGTCPLWAMRKAVIDQAPEYESNDEYVGVADEGSVIAAFAQTLPHYYDDYDCQYYVSAWTFNPAGASSRTSAFCVAFKSATELSYYVNDRAYGLAANTTYRYIIAYSEEG